MCLCTEFQIRFGVSVQKGLVTRRQATRGARRLIFQVVAIKHSTFFFFYSSTKHLLYFKLSDCGGIKRKTQQKLRGVSGTSELLHQLNNCRGEAADPRRLQRSSSAAGSQTVIVLGSSQVRMCETG